MNIKWQYIAASVIALTGAFFGGIYGGLVGAFAGDSWWTNRFALACFQYAAPIGGVCVGATPGLIWLLCLKQKWVWPFLGAGCGALLLPVFESMSIGNSTLGFLFAGTVLLGFLAGLSYWFFYGRKKESGGLRA